MCRFYNVGLCPPRYVMSMSDAPPPSAGPGGMYGGGSTGGVTTGGGLSGGVTTGGGLTGGVMIGGGLTGGGLTGGGVVIL